MAVLRLTIVIVVVIHLISPSHAQFLKAALGFRIGLSPAEKGYGQKGYHGHVNGGKAQLLSGVHGKPQGGWGSQGEQGGHGGQSGHGGQGGGHVGGIGGNFVRHLKILGVNLYLGGQKPHGGWKPQGPKQQIQLYKGPGFGQGQGGHFGGQGGQGGYGGHGGQDFKFGHQGQGGYGGNDFKYGQHGHNYVAGYNNGYDHSPKVIDGQSNQQGQNNYGGIDYSQNEITDILDGKDYSPSNLVGNVFPPKGTNQGNSVQVPSASQIPTYSNEVKSEIQFLNGQGPHLQNQHQRPQFPPIQPSGPPPSAFGRPGPPPFGGPPKSQGFSLASLMKGPQWSPKPKPKFRLNIFPSRGPPPPMPRGPKTMFLAQQMTPLNAPHGNHANQIQNQNQNQIHPQSSQPQQKSPPSPAPGGYSTLFPTKLQAESSSIPNSNPNSNFNYNANPSLNEIPSYNPRPNFQRFKEQFANMQQQHQHQHQNQHHQYQHSPQQNQDFKPQPQGPPRNGGFNSFPNFNAPAFRPLPEYSGKSSYGGDSGPVFGPNGIPSFGGPQGASFGGSNFGEPKGPNFGGSQGSNFDESKGPSFGGSQGSNFDESKGPSFGGSQGPNFGSQGSNFGESKGPTFGPTASSSVNQMSSSFVTGGPSPFNSEYNSGPKSQSSNNYPTVGPVEFGPGSQKDFGEPANNQRGFPSLNQPEYSSGSEGQGKYPEQFNSNGPNSGRIAPNFEQIRGEQVEYSPNGGGPESGPQNYFPGEGQPEYSPNSNNPNGGQMEYGPEGPGQVQIFNQDTMNNPYQLPEGYAYSHSVSSPVISMNKYTKDDPPVMMDPGSMQASQMASFGNNPQTVKDSYNANSDNINTQIQAPVAVPKKKFGKGKLSMSMMTAASSNSYNARNNLKKWRPLSAKKSKSSKEEKDNNDMVPASSEILTATSAERSMVIRKKTTAPPASITSTSESSVTSTSPKTSTSAVNAKDSKPKTT